MSDCTSQTYIYERRVSLRIEVLFPVSTSNSFNFKFKNQLLDSVSRLHYTQPTLSHYQLKLHQYDGRHSSLLPKP